MYNNYIFDLYGTLVDINTDEDNPMLWDKLSMFYSFKGAKYSKEELKESYQNKVKKELSLIKNTNFPDFPLDKVFLSLYEEKGVKVSKDTVLDTAHMFRILSIKYLRLYDGVIEFLEELKRKNKKIYLLSNAQSLFTAYEMKVLDIEKYFDGIIFSADLGICKPDGQFYNAILHKFNLNKKNSIMIGNDSLCDIEGAFNCGLDSLYIHSNLSPDVNSELKSTYSILDGDFRKVSSMILK